MLNIVDKSHVVSVAVFVFVIIKKSYVWFGCRF